MPAGALAQAGRLTQEELSDLAKINLRTLQRIEKGETVPRGNTLKMLCSVLEINMEDILDYGKTEDNKYIRYFHLSVLTFIFIPLGNIIIPLILLTLLFSGLMLTGITLYFDNVVAGTPPDSDSFPPLFIIGGVLFILNIIYPIIVSIMTGRGSLKRYYFPLIRFVRL